MNFDTLQNVSEVFGYKQSKVKFDENSKGGILQYFFAADKPSYLEYKIVYYLDSKRYYCRIYSPKRKKILETNSVFTRKEAFEWISERCKYYEQLQGTLIF